MSFDPNDMNELEEKFESIIKDSEEGYVVELHMSRLAAKELIAIWKRALTGDEDAIMECFGNYSYMIAEIIVAVKDDETDV